MSAGARLGEIVLRSALRISTVVCFAAALGIALSQSCLGQESSVALPDVRINGRLVRVHTQGLFVTDKHFLVTGRVESKPKRAFLFRFFRRDPSVFDFVDLTPTHFAEALDHPGGFDRDRNGVYWIPVSTSNPRGPSVIYGLTIDEDRPLKESISIHSSIRFSDHLGALCCVGEQLMAANWDTKTIYQIRKKDGKTIKAIDRSRFIAKQPDWFLAVQDWKYDAKNDRLVAGGIDKSPGRDRTQSSAVVSWIDLGSKSVDYSTRFPQRDDVSRPMTNEGMALFGGNLFLLPEDLGAGAKVFRIDGSQPTPGR